MKLRQRYTYWRSEVDSTLRIKRMSATTFKEIVAVGMHQPRADFSTSLDWMKVSTTMQQFGKNHRDGLD